MPSQLFDQPTDACRDTALHLRSSVLKHIATDCMVTYPDGIRSIMTCNDLLDIMRCILQTKYERLTTLSGQ